MAYGKIAEVVNSFIQPDNNWRMLVTYLFPAQGGKTALWYAVEKDHTAVVKELLEFGAFTESRRKVVLIVAIL